MQSKRKEGPVTGEIYDGVMSPIIPWVPSYARFLNDIRDALKNPARVNAKALKEISEEILVVDAQNKILDQVENSGEGMEEAFPMREIDFDLVEGSRCKVMDRKFSETDHPGLNPFLQSEVYAVLFPPQLEANVGQVDALFDVYNGDMSLLDWMLSVGSGDCRAKFFSFMRDTSAGARVTTSFMADDLGSFGENVKTFNMFGGAVRPMDQYPNAEVAYNEFQNYTESDRSSDPRTSWVTMAIAGMITYYRCVTLQVALTAATPSAFEVVEINPKLKRQVGDVTYIEIPFRLVTHKWVTEFGFPVAGLLMQALLWVTSRRWDLKMERNTTVVGLERYGAWESLNFFGDQRWGEGDADSLASLLVGLPGLIEAVLKEGAEYEIDDNEKQIRRIENFIQAAQ